MRLGEVQVRLHAYLFSLTRNLSDTDDLFQQTALILWKKKDQFDPQKSFFSWACGIARLEAMNFLRSRSRQKLYFSDELNLQLMAEFEEQSDTDLDLKREALEKCKTGLRENDLQLLSQCYAGKTGVHEAAQKRNRSTQSIHNSLRRIRTALFNCIQKTVAQLGHSRLDTQMGAANHE